MSDKSEARLEFRDRYALEAWLGGQPREVSVVIAARAALRVLPMIGYFTPRKRREKAQQFAVFCAATFRATAVARVAGKYPTRAKELHGAGGRAGASAHGAAHAAGADTGTVASASAYDAVFAGGFAAFAAGYAAADAAAYAASEAADFAAAHAAGVWRTVSSDANLIAAGKTAPALASSPLWSEAAPPSVAAAWNQLRNVLPRDQDWQVWFDWYDARLKGSGRWSEKKELIFATVPEEKWEEGPAAANAWIFERLEELKKKKAASDPTEEKNNGAVEQRLAPVSFRIANGRIDAAPEDAVPIDAEIAADAYAEAKRKAGELRERLQRAQADPALLANLVLLEERLGASFSGLRLGLLLSSLRSLESDFAAFDSEEGRKEHAPDLIAKLGDLAAEVRALAALYPKARAIEAEALALQLAQRPESLDEIETETQKVNAVAEASPLVAEAAAQALREPGKALATARSPVDRAGQLSYRVLITGNFARAALVLAVDEVGGLAGDCWREIRKKVPPTVGRLTAIGVMAAGVLALHHNGVGPENIKLLKEIGAAIENIGKLTGEKPAPAPAPKASEKVAPADRPKLEAPAPKSEPATTPRVQSKATRKKR